MGRLAAYVTSSFRQAISTTPGTMSMLLAGIYVAAGLFCLVAVSSILAERYAIRTVGRDSAPSVVAAQRIKASLADMDSNVANELLGKTGQVPEAVKGYDDRRKEATDNLVTAAENITYGDEERVPIRTIANALGTYHLMIGRARLLHEQDHGADSFRAATKLLHETILPQADLLTKANHEALESAYAREHVAYFAVLTLVLATAAALLAVLVYTQIYLRRRTRRHLNRGLMAATVVAVVLAGWTIQDLHQSHQSLYVAKEQAFDSLNALWRARAEAYDGNGAESRWLLAWPFNNAAEIAHFQQEFTVTANDIMKLPASRSVADVAGAIRSGEHPEGFTGKLADELNNITFPGELEAALKALSSFGVYNDIDARIRQLQRDKKRAEAVALCVGTQPGQSNWAFEKFDDALGDVIALNQQEFDQAVDRGLGVLKGYEYAAPVAVLVIIVLAAAGMRPRLREYAA